MRLAFTKTTLLALLAATTCAGGLAVSASAATTGTTTGGATSAPTGSAPSLPKVHKTAIATWFGPGFYGQKTACGQTLTPLVVGVANRTLPCGTLVKVSYLRHRLVVPVIDRGPYANGADWDLTTEAAHALGVEETVRIGTRVVGSVPNTPTLGLPPGAPTVALTGGAVSG
ncbi:MAG TPA: septal ring lytic transglycosylase RlpA family protein [Solirubrobacteraceae bacterium]|jgi:rare lipoprotein A (peptidoglycan hydrolase)